ncbi:uncharacterized protein ARMOST_18183 [Armillaria ostoyae]|uniref:Deoxyribonuclease NucA/NucB domain-containing protein n=1 Tax=Armillaria ostoyae TaxID=47428 RepID=A0A284S177_ARMOS|nr:uncharacterized protein ARMOST_18183 [Armillaria ostoyae]
MLKSLFIVTCLLLLGVHALPTELSNATTAWNATATGIAESVAHTFTLDYRGYPQSCENIYRFSWFCNNGPRSVAPDRTNAAAHRLATVVVKTQTGAALACLGILPGKLIYMHLSYQADHVSGHQCDEWPWANSNAGGANAATRCIPASDNTGSGAQWGNFVNNKGSQALGYIDNGVPVAIKVSNIPKTAHFCLGETGTPITKDFCKTDHIQPMLQSIG